LGVNYHSAVKEENNFSEGKERVGRGTLATGTPPTRKGTHCGSLKGEGRFTTGLGRHRKGGTWGGGTWGSVWGGGGGGGGLGTVKLAEGRRSRRGGESPKPPPTTRLLMTLSRGVLWGGWSEGVKKGGSRGGCSWRRGSRERR